MSTALVPIAAHDPGAVVVRAPGFAMAMPAFIGSAGAHASRATLEFFISRIANPYTRRAYGRAVGRFCAWCEENGVRLAALDTGITGAYVRSLESSLSLASVKLAASAIRHWLDYLTEERVLGHNPARSVRTARLVVTEGKTPAMSRAQARRLFATLDHAAAAGELLALRDRALFAVMLYGFVRVGAATRMQVADFEDDGELTALVVHEKGGKTRRLPCHHQTRAYLRAYITAAQLVPGADEALFQSMPRRSAKLSGRALSTGQAWAAVKRWCQRAELPAKFCNHSFRATGITLHQENGGRLEDAQDLAGHADARTTRLYVRKSRETAQAEVERVQL